MPANNKIGWISQLSLAFARCDGYYKSEIEGEVEISFRYNGLKRINIFLRDELSSDVNIFYDAIVNRKYSFMNSINIPANGCLQIIDLAPGIGLACILFNNSFDRCIIFACENDDKNKQQLEKNFLSNNIINHWLRYQSVYETNRSPNKILSQFNGINISYDKDMVYYLSALGIISEKIKCPESTLLIINFFQAFALFSNFNYYKQYLIKMSFIAVDCTGLEIDDKNQLNTMFMESFIEFSYEDDVIVIQMHKLK